LPLSDLRGLRLFDVVLMDYTEYLNQRRVFVRCGSSLAFHASVEQSQLTLEDVITPESADSSLLASGGSEDLPCELRFELARMAIPVEQWALVQPGDVLNLPQRADDSVSIVVGNATLGSGEVVQVGDRLGVRLRSPNKTADGSGELKLTQFPQKLGEL
jgi:flagellar motor switch/type III secretory pathway protein FliN